MANKSGSFLALPKRELRRGTHGWKALKSPTGAVVETGIVQSPSESQIFVEIKSFGVGQGGCHVSKMAVNQWSPHPVVLENARVTWSYPLQRNVVRLSFVELERFYQRLVTKARGQGITCAITSGMACVEFGVAETTKDCDLLCTPQTSRKLLDLLSGASLEGHLPAYRGHLTAPLEERWLRGGWTSHFVWNAPGTEAYLDVFGVAPRSSAAWEKELEGFCASRHTVAEMKRTNREKDWPYATALGAQMIEAGDARGWLHIFDTDLLLALARIARPPASLIKRRPVLALAVKGDSRLRSALHAEVQFWHELDRVRLGIYQKAVRPYMRAVTRTPLLAGMALAAQHEARVRCAEEHLPLSPLVDYGVIRLIEQARTAVAGLVNPSALAWLPDVRQHFKVEAE